MSGGPAELLRVRTASGAGVGGWHHFRLACGKTLLLKRRRVGSSLCELVLPAVFVGLLLIGHFLADNTVHGAENYASKAVFNLTREVRNVLCASPAPDDPPDVVPQPNPIELSPCPAYVSYVCRDPHMAWRLFRPLVKVPGNGVYVCYNLNAQLNLSHLVDLVANSGAPSDVMPLDTMALMQQIATMVLGSLSFNVGTVQNSLLHRGDLLFALADPLRGDAGVCGRVRALMRYMNETTMTFPTLVRGPPAADAVPGCPDVWSTESAASAAAHRSSSEQPTWALIVFHGLDFDPGSPELGYTLRLNYTATPFTRYSRRSARSTGVGRGLGSSYNMYRTSGFTTLQYELFRAYANISAVPISPAVTESVAQVPFPTTNHTTNEFLRRAGDIIPLVLSLSFIYPVSRVVSGIVEEKELRLREGMLIMGLTRTAFYGSWVTISVLNVTLTSLLMSVMMATTFMARTAFLLLFLLLWLYALTMVALGMLVTVFFSRARIAAVAGPLAVILFVIPHFAVPDDIALGSQQAMSVLSPTAFATAFTQLTTYERTGDGATFADASADPYSFSFALLMLAADTALYLVLFLYMDVVLPSEYGVRRSPIFFLLPSYWRGQGGGGAGVKELSESPVECAADDADSSPRVERTRDTAAVRVRIKDLTKVFSTPSGPLVAVDHLDLAFREGRIQVVLGHNGAGKTTLFNMLTGLLPPTSGDCTVWGTSIATEIDTVRRDLGLCPQHNILWPALSCMEHLRFFGRLKGLDPGRVEELALQLLDLVGLHEKRLSASSTLSGGQKRKLSVAIALIGGARLVFLDEPTAGMDVGARRALWTLLKRPEILDGRVIVLTTHYMDEADLLGDSIAILQTGKLHSWGTPLFLKSKLGVGYHLTATAQHGGSVSAVPEIVRKHLGDSVRPLQLTQVDTRMSLSRESTEGFPALFSELDEAAERDRFDYGVGLTTLEEVFMRIAKERAEAPAPAGEDTACEDLEEGGACGDTDPLLELATDEGRATGRALYGQQLLALLLKRVHYGKRDRRTLFFQFVLPILFILFALLLKRINPAEQPDLALDETFFEYPSEIPFAAQDGSSALFGGCAPPSPQCPFGSRFELFNVTANRSSPNTSTQVSQWLLDTYFDHAEVNRWAGYAAPDVFHHNRSSGDPALWVHADATVLHNSTESHAFPAALALLQSAALRQATVPTASVKVHNHPLPISDYEQKLVDHIKVIITGVFVMVPFTLLPSNFVGFIVREKAEQVKHLQLVSGLNIIAYWTANFIFDFCSYLISVGLALLIFQADGRGEFTGHETIGGTVLLFLLYGVAAITTSYLLSFCFTSHTSAQNAVMAGNVVCGFLLVIAGQLLDLFDETRSANRVLKYFYRLVPSYCLGEGIIQLSILPIASVASDALGYDAPGDSATAWGVTGRNDVYLASVAPVAMIIVLCLDSTWVAAVWGRARRWVLQRLKAARGCGGEEVSPLLGKSGSLQRSRTPSCEEEGPAAAGQPDEDVARERREVLSGQRAGDAVSVRELRKVYGNGTVAVRGVTFGVRPGEVFAFLGHNGAGKTTTIRAITAEIAPSSGDVYIAGVSVAADPAAARRGVGLCPQFDALLDLLTVEETLKLFARLRGLQGAAAARERAGLVRALGLGPFRNTVAKALSGGNRRKLSLAVALTGAPRLALLDEPSAGMDPQARRELWKVVGAAAQAEGRSVVLTTHHLEEVEALSGGTHRVAIMANGALQCVAPLQRLKSRFGGGYELAMQAADPGPASTAVEEWVRESFPSATLTERTAARLAFRLPDGADGGVRLADAFAALAACPLLQSGELAHYALSQLSLEQVFLRVSASAEAAESGD